MLKRSLVIVGVAVLSLTLIFSCGKPEEPAKAQKPSAEEKAAAEKKAAEEKKAAVQKKAEEEKKAAEAKKAAAEKAAKEKKAVEEKKATTHKKDAKKKKPVNLSDLKGMRASSLDAEMKARGFVNKGGFQRAGAAYSTWWNATTEQCVFVTTKQGRVHDVRATYEGDCR